MLIDKEKINYVLKKDGIIAFVTDTVWGIGCLPTSERACKRIYELKKRDDKKPLTLMSDSIYSLIKYVKHFTPKAEELIERHFPGALTLVLEKSDTTPNHITKGLDTIAIRVPNNATFKAICECVPGRVLATTSANISGMPPAISYEQVVKNYELKVDYVIEDFGNKAEGTASTIACLFDEQVTIYRQGKVQV